ncbi:hypothetical protein BDZ97DRAFT_1812751 [Flammula alnicola]|nr:hypothetical protein BDZ97DRAFT_1812751 [Flammula alnicola]
MSTAVTQPHGTSSSLGTRSPPIYEFPKRKRWADLLLTELVDDVAFVLSPSYKILYCGAAVTELLGWRDVDLLDLDFADLIDSADQFRFRTAFEQAIRSNAESNLAIKLKGKVSTAQYPSSPKDVIFDIKFYPHIVENEVEAKCIFAMASPYPSKNTAMLNTILDLKAENDRLQQKVTEYRNRLPAEAFTSGRPPPSQAGSMYATSSLHPKLHAPVSGSMPQKSAELPGAYLTSSTMLSGTFEGASSSPADPTEFGKSSVYASTSANPEDQGEEGSKKKKLKRAQNAEQYVCITCGRTDSPEWRKGPLGPKTLCNACGLRWAKQMRKVEGPAQGAISSSTAADS